MNLSSNQNLPGPGIFAALILLLLAFPACSSAGNNDNAGAPGIVVVNAPATGEVKRILTPEGVHVSRGTPVIEIAVEDNPAATTSKPGESAEAQAVRNYQAADAEIEAARAEAVRHGAEVERLTPLVAAGQASQGELDGERALFEGAQRRLQQAQDAKRNAEGGLLAARQPGVNRDKIIPESSGQTVSAVATSAGTVAVISARVGDKVKVGEPLATIRADK